jgi:sugar lactone lactonase YvrE
MKSLGKRILLVPGGLLSLLVVASAVFIALPSPIHPTGWKPLPAPDQTGPLAPNEELSKSEVVSLAAEGPVDITFDAKGNLYTGDESGVIYRLSPGGQAEKYAETGGRPSGLKFTPDGSQLIAADTQRGLLSVDRNGKVTVLAATAGGRALKFANSLAITHDGVIYFSNTDDKPYDVEDNHVLAFLESHPTGRLVRYDLKTRQIDVVLDNLNFATGVALAPDESFVLVNEMFHYRITRYWLTGPKTGTSDIFADNLPGIPFNINSVGDGSYWVGLRQPRLPALDSIQDNPFLKAQMAKLPESMLGSAALRISTALLLNSDGHPVRNLTDSTGHVYGLSSVIPHDGYLYFGTASRNSSNNLTRIKLQGRNRPLR